MSPGARAARAAWLAYWNAMRRWHRYEVREPGLDRLLDVWREGPALLVGYHGRPIAHDLCMLQALLLERTGRLPRAIIHEYFRVTPGLRWLYDGFEFLAGDGDEMAQAVARGDLIFVTPGGTREGTRSSLDRYRVEWGPRVGYVRLALRYGLPLVPAAAWGVDDTYLALNDGFAWGQRLGLPGGLPAWIGIGAVGPWPLSPPLPVKITQVIGSPIRIDPSIDPRDRAALAEVHGRVVAAVQQLLDARRGVGAA
mgnify:CR=1 FL=1